MNDLQYPVGKFELSVFPNQKERKILIKNIAELPGKLKLVVKELSDERKVSDLCDDSNRLLRREP